jgi:hypothetical protein
MFAGERNGEQKNPALICEERDRIFACVYDYSFITSVA